jgi:maintenance of morphology protein 1
VPKIAQLIESRVHAWFDERAVEPRFQQISLPSLWPRKHNTRGGATEDAEDEGIDITAPDGDDVAVPAAGLGLDVPEEMTLEERIEAEGAKLREAEILAGERKAGRRREEPRGLEPARGNERRADDGMRWRGEGNRSRDTSRPQPPNRFKSEHYSGQKGMPGAMLE